MKVIRVSSLTGQMHIREINVTPAQMYSWQNGEYIQVAMAEVSAEDREFIMSGITPEEWAAAFPEGEG